MNKLTITSLDTLHLERLVRDSLESRDLPEEMTGLLLLQTIDAVRAAFEQQFNYEFEYLLNEKTAELEQKLIDEKMSEARKYKHIEAWGKMMGSYRYYINNEQLKALETNAPINAIYRNGDEWQTFDDITNEDVSRSIALYVEGLKND